VGRPWVNRHARRNAAASDQYQHDPLRAVTLEAFGKGYIRHDYDHRGIPEWRIRHAAKGNEEMKSLLALVAWCLLSFYAGRRRCALIHGNQACAPPGRHHNTLSVTRSSTPRTRPLAEAASTGRFIAPPVPSAAEPAGALQDRRPKLTGASAAREAAPYRVGVARGSSGEPELTALALEFRGE